MHVRKIGVLFVLLVSFAGASASATTINFAALQAKTPDPELPGALMVGTSYTQQGFVIASIGGRFDVWKLGNSNFPGTSSAATSLFDFSAGAETSITYGANKPFTLNSIDFAPLLSGGSGPFYILVSGVISPGQPPITQLVTINNSPFGSQRVTFPGFTNVIAVNFIQATSAGYFQGQETAYQFNNIIVNTRYVNGVNGNDSKDCLSVQTACKTIAHAISLAASGDSITIAPAVYRENLTITSNLNLKLIGSNARTTIIDGAQSRVISILSTTAVITLSNLTIRNGIAPAGGGILNWGHLTLSNSAITGNYALSESSATGGGIYNSGTLTVSNSTFSANTTTANFVYGGAIYSSGPLVMNNSTVSGNSVSGRFGGGGGGIYAAGATQISNTTIAGNSGNSGGGIYTAGGATRISNTTIVGNSGNSGGGIYEGGGTVATQNSIVSGSSPGGNCFGTMTSNGYNLSSDNTCNFNNTGDLNNTDPLLGPLQNNGGPTQTMALPSGSPAVDAGNPSGCTDGAGHLLKTDQRGQPRPDKKDSTTLGCDVGAYELQNH